MTRVRRMRRHPVIPRGSATCWSAIAARVRVTVTSTTCQIHQGLRNTLIVIFVDNSRRRMRS